MLWMIGLVHLVGTCKLSGNLIQILMGLPNFWWSQVHLISPILCPSSTSIETANETLTAWHSRFRLLSANKQGPTRAMVQFHSSPQWMQEGQSCKKPWTRRISPLHVRGVGLTENHLRDCLSCLSRAHSSLTFCWDVNQTRPSLLTYEPSFCFNCLSVCPVCH